MTSSSSYLKLNLSSRLYELLLKAGLDCPKQILLKSDHEIKSLITLTNHDLSTIQSVASKAILNKNIFFNVNEVLIGMDYRWKRLSCGCPQINNLLGGGLAARGITEIFGESGTGKTQFCLQLAITVQYPESCGGFNAGAVYICTEDSFPNRRLYELLKKFPSAYNKQININNPIDEFQFGDNIFIEHKADVISLTQCICERLPSLLTKKKIGLIIIDSIGAIFRTEPVSPIRSNQMRNIAMKLNKLATEFRLSVVCINQVSSVMNNTCGSVIPCLGLSWSNLITTRLQFLRDQPNISDTVLKTPNILRKIKILFAPDIPLNSLQFIVNENGVQGVEN